MFKKYLLKLIVLVMALGTSGCHLMYFEDHALYQPTTTHVVKRYRSPIVNSSVAYRHYSPYETYRSYYPYESGRGFNMYTPYGGFSVYSSRPSPAPFVWSHTVVEDSYYPF